MGREIEHRMWEFTSCTGTLLIVSDDEIKEAYKALFPSAWLQERFTEGVESLQAELRTLRADKERLDWLEADAPRYDHDPEARIERVRALWWDGRPSFKARAAIDAAKGNHGEEAE